jgi:hypothetical protein
MDTDTIDAVEEQQEEETLTRPSSWFGALAQLPGFPIEGKPEVPRAATGAAREVTSTTDEDLAVDE